MTVMPEATSIHPANPPTPWDAEGALAAYRRLIDRYAGTLDLLSSAAQSDLDRWLAESERYAEVLQRWAPATGPILDLGTGVGLPGVVVAVRCYPREVWWVERRRRRTAFLTQVAAQARLENVRLFGVDVREVTLERSDGGAAEAAAEGAGRVAAITAQGVGTFLQVAHLTQHLIGRGTLLLSRKGPDALAEVEELQRGWSELHPGGITPTLCEQVPLGGRGSLFAVAFVGG